LMARGLRHDRKEPQFDGIDFNTHPIEKFAAL
jgi:hypothetical protein